MTDQFVHHHAAHARVANKICTMISKMISRAVLSRNLRQVYLLCQELFAADQRRLLREQDHQYTTIAGTKETSFWPNRPVYEIYNVKRLIS